MTKAKPPISPTPKKVGAKAARVAQMNKSINLASIVQKLPFHQQLSASQQLTLKITPIWFEWCEQQRSRKGSRHFSAAQDTELSVLDGDVLVLACSNLNTATLLKHQRVSLLEMLQKEGFKQLRQIRVRMANRPAVEENSANNQRHTSNTAQDQHQTYRKKPNTTSITSIESVQRRIKHEPLAVALARLADTLKKQ